MWACERGVFVNAGLQNTKCLASAMVSVFSFLLLFARFLLVLPQKSMLFVWLFSFFCVFDAMCMSFLIVFASRSHIVAICMFLFVL